MFKLNSRVAVVEEHPNTTERVQPKSIWGDDDPWDDVMDMLEERICLRKSGMLVSEL